MKKEKPDWLKVRIPSGSGYYSVNSLIERCKLHTVCQEAKCPNIGRCFSNGTATLMILGHICTRDCRYCYVKYGNPVALDEDEPERVAEAVRNLNLTYAVITSVTRDDLADGGARIFFRTVKNLKKLPVAPAVEILIPDFKGDENSLDIVINSGAEVINHNIEVVKNLFKEIRPQGDYEISLRLLKRIKEINKDVITKSGLMIGLGESFGEIRDTMKGLVEKDVDILTIGQYLQPSKTNAEVKKYYLPEEFIKLRNLGLDLGFKEVVSGPLVRSSFGAKQAYEKVRRIVAA